MSFAKLMQRFQRGATQPVGKRQDPLRLATAAILLDIANADGSFTPAEDGDITGFLKSKFQLADDEVRELIDAAGEVRARTIDHFSLTNYIRRNSSLAERIDIVRTMWRMVYGDGRLTDYENYLVRKMADLLGLEHHVMIGAKVDVLRELGIESK